MLIQSDRKKGMKKEIWKNVCKSITGISQVQILNSYILS